jgi:hypothetical protein
MPTTEELLRRLAREVRDHAGAYTRAFGREDNSARVLELTNSDTYALGERMLAVLDTGSDPGDSRYICGFGSCALPKGHSAPHVSTLP